MKIQDFIDYKIIIESNGVITNDEANKIYSWMEKTGRIDESLWGSIWSWLKRNFSVKSKKLHGLADEYEKELTEEMRAEYGAMKDSKDLASKFRRGSYMKLSRDIEERMDLIAGDDEDYKELARILINKKNLSVRRAMLKEFSGKIDPEDQQQEQTDINKYQNDVDKKYNDIINKKFKDQGINFKPIVDFLKKKIDQNGFFYKQVGIVSREDKEEFIKLIINYVHSLSEKIKEMEFSNKTVYEISKKYVELVKELSNKIKDNDTSFEKSSQIIKKALNRLMKDEKPLPFERLKSDVLKEIEKQKSSSGESADKKLPDDIVTANTEKIAGTTVDSMLDKAKEETDKKNPTITEITDEIRDSIKKYFNESLTTLHDNLIENVKEFNSYDKETKNKLKGKFEYSLDKDDKLSVPSMDDVKQLLHDFIKIAGKILPYYEYAEKSVKYASIAVSEYLFEIYAIKKDIDKKLTEDDIDNIVEAIKTKK